MARQLAIVVVLLLPLQSGCTLLFGHRLSNPGGSGGNGSSGGGGGGGGGGNGGSCLPVGCAAVGAVCGSIADGCGGIVVCGNCSPGQFCGGDGANRCGDNMCVPKTCQQLGATCGQFSDGCAGVVDCGACACTPTTCAAQNASCGPIADGCGHTLDCGTCPPGSWQSIGNFAYNFVSVAYDASGLWIADDIGHVLRSTDDAQFTSQQLSGTISTLFAASGDVFAGGSDGIFHKAPGASAFALVPASPQYVEGIHGVVGDLYAVTYQYTGGIYHSVDGSGWTDLTPMPAPGRLRAVFAPKPLEVYAVGSGGMIYHSIDDGMSWSSKSMGTTVELYGVWASGALALAVGNTGIYRSTDQGATWARVYVGSVTLNSIAGTAVNDVWIAGDNTTILHSTDGGASWSPAPDVSGGVPLNGIAAATDKVYAVGDDGAIAVRRN